VVAELYSTGTILNQLYSTLGGNVSFPAFSGMCVAVLPGPEAASPLIEQKTTAIWRKHTAISNLSKIPLFFCYFFSVLCTNYQLQEANFP
jgi:hypothetical protein